MTTTPPPNYLDGWLPPRRTLRTEALAHGLSAIYLGAAYVGERHTRRLAAARRYRLRATRAGAPR